MRTIGRVIGKIAILSMAHLLPGCSQQNSPSSLRRVHEQSWTEKSSDNFHGTFLKARRFDASFCKPCHSLEAGKWECWDCHADFPKKNGLLDPTSLNFHGQSVTSKDSLQERCAKCHGEDFQGGRVEVPCRSCHAYPHNDGYLATHREDIRAQITTIENYNQNPGEAMQNFRGYYNCLACHLDSEILQRGFKPGCRSCHAGGTKGFTNHDNMASIMAAHPDQARSRPGACEVCHAPISEENPLNQTIFFDGSGAEKKPNLCMECHTPAHFEDGWQHWLEVGENGFSRCQPCHGENYEGSEYIPGCAQCHPEGKNFGPVPHIGANWPNRTGHGAYVASNGTERCATCHSVSDPAVASTSWPDGTFIPSCYSCHDGPTGKPASHGTSWPLFSASDAATHAGFLMANYYDPVAWTLNLGPTGGNCETCHYENGNNWSTCETCHAPYPKRHIGYNPDWMTPGNPNSHGALYAGNYQAACATACHGPDLQGGSSGVSCYLCHSF